MKLKYLFFITLGTFVLHALFFLCCISKGDYALMTPDSLEYNQVAHQVLAGNGIVNHDGSSSFYRLPCYPLFLAFCYKCFGDSINVALWIQIILTSFIPVLIYFFVLVLFPLRSRMALCAALVAMLHPGFALYSGMLTTEAVFMLPWFLFLILFFTGMFGNKNYLFGAGLPRRSLQAKAGVMLGVASLIRPIGHYVLALALLMLLIEWCGSRAETRDDKKGARSGLQDSKQELDSGESCHPRLRFGIHIKKISKLILGWLIIVIPLLLRNYLLTGALFFHTLPGVHFVKYTATEIIMERDHIEREIAYPIALTGWHSMVVRDEEALGRSLNEYERCLRGEAYTTLLIKQNPWVFVTISIKQMLKTCLGFYAAQPLFVGSIQSAWHTRFTTVWEKIKRFLRPQVRDWWLVPFVYLDMIMHVILSVGTVSFISYALVMRSLWWVLALMLPFMMLFVGLTLAYGCARLRMPIEPFLIIMTCWWVRERV